MVEVIVDGLAVAQEMREEDGAIVEIVTVAINSFATPIKGKGGD